MRRVRPNQEKVRSTTQRRGKTTKPFRSSLRLTISRRNTGTLATAASTCHAIIRPDQFEPRETIADFVKNEGRPITILNTRGVNDDPYWQPFSIDERMDLAPFHLLAGVVA